MIKVITCTIIFIFLSYNSLSFASAFRFSPRPNKAHLITWRHWDRKALDEAKKSDKLILLSLSAVWCHWCHVMDETTYSDKEIIDFINNNFIPIRVDSDMRPDIDSMYNQGGWPSTAILTPEGEIIDGGTYIPAADMKMRLKRIVGLYAEQKEGIRERVEMIRKELQAAPAPESSSPDEIDIARASSILESTFDGKHGGFGMWQKFPNPDAIDFLLSGYFHLKKQSFRDMVTLTLDNMANGEIYDSVEGGFFRYSTKPDWSVPHYEKMIFDNAGLIKNYADANITFKDTSYKRVITKSLKYIQLNLTDKKTGMFYGSQDADEEYYKKKNRKGLTPPYVDKTTYTDSNARMISALVSSHRVTGDKAYLNIAQKTAGFIVSNLYTKSDGAYHYYFRGNKQLKGLLSDNVLFASALLDLYNITGQRKYLITAKETGNYIMSNFYSNTNKQFRASLDTTIIIPVKTGMLQDYQTALVNFRTAILLSRLYYITPPSPPSQGGAKGDGTSHGGTKEVYQKPVTLSRDQIKTVVHDVLSTYKATYDNFTPAVPLYGTALRWHLKEPAEIHIVASPQEARSFLKEINKVYIPEKTVLVLTPKHDSETIRALNYAPDMEAVYVCKGKRCSRPVAEPKDVIPSMKRFLDLY